ncbi:MAG: SGNH/GDSL hydrolase family protein [Acetobacteraceae bacterium]|nr:SGNH/GDSL hydrolase family protein [Acetobacteraceae bacterium]
MILASFAMFGTAGANPVYDRIVAFGDSLSDAGNVFHLTSSDPAAYHPDPPPALGSPSFSAYYMGRASNGPNWVDQLADRLGLPRAAPSLDGGSNYSYASARSGPGTIERYPSPTYPPNPPVTVLRVGAQIDAFVAAEGRFKPDDLVTLWVGANDFRELILGQTSVSDIINNIAQHVQTLDSLGAQTILVPSQVDLSRPPVFQPYAAVLHSLSVQFHESLAARLQSLMADPAIKARIVPVDAFTAMERVFGDPAAFGFTNLTDPALTFDPATGAFSQVADVGGYFWRDTIHPTTKAQAIFAEAALDALVPP